MIPTTNLILPLDITPSDLLPQREALAWIGEALGRGGPINIKTYRHLARRDGLPLITIGRKQYFSPSLFKVWVEHRAQQAVLEMLAQNPQNPQKRKRAPGRPRKHPLPTAI